MNWMLLWKIVFVVVLALFATMTVLTTIYGARDVRRLLRSLDEDQADRDQKDSTDESSS